MRNLLLLLISLLPARLIAQDCFGMTFKPGMGFEMQSYTAKDKPNGRMTYLVKNVRKEGAATVMDIEFTSFDDQDKPRQNAVPVKYTCTGDEIIADLSNLMMGAGQTQAFKDAEMRIKTNQLSFPRTLTAGQKLPDGRMEGEFYNNGTLTMSMDMTVANRQVGPKESLTTPAGTFDVYKVSSDMALKNRVAAMNMSIPFNMKNISYRANNTIFDVRTETYNKNGKLMGYTVLTKIF
jgi:hypothetical protein